MQLSKCHVFTKVPLLMHLNTRLRYENILAMEMDLPERVTFDFYEGGVIDPRMQAAVDAVLGFDRHSFLVFMPAGAPGPLHLGGPPAVPEAAYGVREEGTRAGAGAGGQRPGSAGQRPGSGGGPAGLGRQQQRPQSASRAGRPGSGR